MQIVKSNAALNAGSVRQSGNFPQEVSTRAGKSKNERKNSSQTHRQTCESL